MNLCTTNRKKMVELVKIFPNEGATGSSFENEANAEAGKIMRWFAKKNPGIFNYRYVVEETIAEGINDRQVHSKPYFWLVALVQAKTM
jgi:hypothetical protein